MSGPPPPPLGLGLVGCGSGRSPAVGGTDIYGSLASAVAAQHAADARVPMSPSIVR